MYAVEQSRQAQLPGASMTGPVGCRFLDELSPEVRACLMSKARRRRYRRGMTIAIEGEAAPTLKILCSGWVKLYRVSSDGSEAVLATLTTGQSFDEIAALRREPSPASAEAATDCELIHLDPASICACPNAAREIQQAVIGAAAEHAREAFDQLQQIKVQTGVHRLAGFLVALCADRTGAVSLSLPYDKHLVAGTLGMKPESLSRAFQRLKALGVRTRARRVEIEDAAALRAFARGGHGATPTGG